MTLDEAILFWKSEFCKKVPAETFEKSYAYNIRHMYGQEGKKQDYKGWGCSKIISLTTPATGEFHGCPFKVLQDDMIKRMLVDIYHVNDHQLKEIMMHRDRKQFQVACVRLFEASHPNGASEGIGNHPMSYFNSSQTYHKDINKGKTPNQSE